MFEQYKTAIYAALAAVLAMLALGIYLYVENVKSDRDTAQKEAKAAQKDLDSYNTAIKIAAADNNLTDVKIQEHVKVVREYIQPDKDALQNFKEDSNESLESTIDRMLDSVRD